MSRNQARSQISGMCLSFSDVLINSRARYAGSDESIGTMQHSLGATAAIKSPLRRTVRIALLRDEKTPTAGSPARTNRQTILGRKRQPGLMSLTKNELSRDR